MAINNWTRRSFGCAVSDAGCLVLSARYHTCHRRLLVDNAWFGSLKDKDFVSRLTRKIGRRTLWVPLSFAKETDRNDVKIFCIDDAGGTVPLAQAVRTQLMEAEADKQGRYVRVSATLPLAGKRKHTVGASAPHECVEDTFSEWSRYGFLNPCIGSVRTAIVNLFLALHQREPQTSAESVHQILVYQTGSMDLFCYLRSDAFVDSGGILTKSDSFVDVLKNLNAWGQQCSKKHQFSDNVKVCVVRSEPFGDDFAKQLGNVTYKGLAVWTPLFENEGADPAERGTITYTTDAVKQQVLAHRGLAVPALGLALHGV